MIIDEVIIMNGIVGFLVEVHEHWEEIMVARFDCEIVSFVDRNLHEVQESKNEKLRRNMSD